MTTYANWVSKTANLLTDELGLDAGDTVLIDLPPHWLVPVFLGAAWSAGLSVTDDRGAAHDVAVCGPDSIGEHDDAEHVLACSLLPFAVRFSDPVPGQVLDFGLLWPGQSDVFVAVTPPSPDTVAWVSSERPRTHADLLEEAAFTEPRGRGPTAHRHAPGGPGRGPGLPGADGARRLSGAAQAPCRSNVARAPRGRAGHGGASRLADQPPSL